MDEPSGEFDLSGRVALVTGASRGIGRAVAEALAGAGVKVAAGYRTGRDEAEGLAGEIRARGGAALPVGGDVADPAAIEAMVVAAREKLGPIDILVSNAGTARKRALEELSIEEWDATFHEHLRAAFLLAKRLAPGMRERRFGRILFMSSVAAFTGGIVGPHYTAAKAGLIGLMHSLAAGLAPHGVTVNAVAPALVETGALAGLDDPARGGLARRVPVGRLGRPEEVADLVLAVVRNPYITGQTFLVDGGVYPR
jgi:3-oxoacyl-[acyl-carrier protein] reductase